MRKNLPSFNHFIKIPIDLVVDRQNFPILIAIILPILSIFPQNKTFWVVGDLVETGKSQGLSYFSVRNSNSGRIQHVICQDESVESISKAFQSQENSQSREKLHIHVKAKSFQLGSPLLRCISNPRLRRTNFSKKFRKSNGSYENEFHSKTGTVQEINELQAGDRRVMGQVLSADVESGLLTIQTARRKTYIKVDPEIALSIRQKLSRMEIQNINGIFRYDRNKGYFVGSENSFR